jgi:hypothetical protein
MNCYIFSAIIVSVLLISVSVLLIPVSFASAEDQTIKFHNTDGSGSLPIYSFVQVIHRNSNGDLLAFIQSEKMTDLDTYAINFYIDGSLKQENRQPQVIKAGEEYMELHSEIFTNYIDSPNMTASTLFMVAVPTEENPNEYEPRLSARFAHDGLLLNPGDILTTHWYFIRLL